MGDHLVACDDELPVGANRRLRTATVEATWRTVAPTVTIGAGPYQVTCSPNHKWLGPNWREAISLHLGVMLSGIAPPQRTADVCDRVLEPLSVSVDSLVLGPPTELVDIQTSTGTFIAEGLFTHNCYAEELAARYRADVWGKTAPRRILSDDNWKKPIKWNRDAERSGQRHKVFCASMADVFEPHPDLVEPRKRLWDLIEKTPWLDWQLLTKRPEEVSGMVPWGNDWPEWVWLGTSVEDQTRADLRVPILLKIPAAIRFLSCEPLLGPIDISAFVSSRPSGLWVVVGGESGPNHRKMDLEWAYSIAHQCTQNDVPVWMKQDSGPRPGMQGRISDEMWARKEFPRTDVRVPSQTDRLV